MKTVRLLFVEGPLLGTVNGYGTSEDESLYVFVDCVYK
jgi:hypothetical protein